MFMELYKLGSFRWIWGIFSISSSSSLIFPKVSPSSLSRMLLFAYSSVQNDISPLVWGLTWSKFDCFLTSKLFPFWDFSYTDTLAERVHCFAIDSLIVATMPRFFALLDFFRRLQAVCNCRNSDNSELTLSIVKMVESLLVVGTATPSSLHKLINCSLISYAFLISFAASYSSSRINWML